MWPLIIRELRGSSRRWTTYWLRLLAAGSVISAILLWLSNHVYLPQAEPLVFEWMHYIMLAAIWIVVPLMTCDCISSEKREGTLGLLFLTNLNAREIVFAKTAVQGFRALTLWLATVPLIVVPILLGGLSWREIVLSCCFSLASICFALSVGVVASGCSHSLNRSVALAVLLAPLAHLIFAVFALLVIVMTALVTGIGDWEDPVGILDLIGEALSFVWNYRAGWSHTSVTPKVGLTWILAAAMMIFVSVLILIATIIIVADRLRRNWKDKPKTKRQTEVESFFCKEVFWQGTFRRWMRRSLERNPIGWLEKRNWTGRISSWIWLAIMISFATTLAYGTAAAGFGGFGVLMWMLLISIAYVAAGSFRRERETGALELILVTPLSERQIIFGRLHGLWSQFLPMFAVWIAVVLYLSSALKNWQLANVFQFAVLYLIVPIVGLYFSLRSRFVLLSWTATLAVCFALPQLAWWGFKELAANVLSGWGFPAAMDLTTSSLVDWQRAIHTVLANPEVIMVPAQLAIAVLLLWRLHVNLARRTFSLR